MRRYPLPRKALSTKSCQTPTPKSFVCLSPNLKYIIVNPQTWNVFSRPFLTESLYFPCATFLWSIILVRRSPLPRSALFVKSCQLPYSSSFLLASIELNDTQSLWASNTSPPGNRCTFLWSSCSVLIWIHFFYRTETSELTFMPNPLRNPHP